LAVKEYRQISNTHKISELLQLEERKPCQETPWYISLMDHPVSSSSAIHRPQKSGIVWSREVVAAQADPGKIFGR